MSLSAEAHRSAAQAQRRERERARSGCDDLALTVCSWVEGYGLIRWSSPEEAHEACRVLMADQRCNRHCLGVHMVVVRMAGVVRCKSYGPTPVGFGPGSKDRYIDLPTGMRRIVRGAPAKPVFVESRAELFKRAYPRRQRELGEPRPEFWPAPWRLNEPLDEAQAVRQRLTSARTQPTYTTQRPNSRQR